jgi:hypothetical protein
MSTRRQTQKVNTSVAAREGKISWRLRSRSETPRSRASDTVPVPEGCNVRCPAGRAPYLNQRAVAATSSVQFVGNGRGYVENRLC